MSSQTDIIRNLGAAVPDGVIVTGADEMAPYLTDRRGQFLGKAACIARPRPTAERGLGQHRIAEWVRLRPPAEREIVRRVKRALDPDLTLNPGRAVPLPGQGGFP